MLNSSTVINDRIAKKMSESVSLPSNRGKDYISYIEARLSSKLQLGGNNTQQTTEDSCLRNENNSDNNMITSSIILVYP